MERKHALLFAFLITLLIFSNVYLFKAQNKNLETVTISRVLDGDTFELDDGRKIRLANINAPEKNQHGSNLSIEFLKQFLNYSVDLEIIGIEKYSRFLARAYAPNYLNLEMVEKGYASKFLVDSSELNKFASAEEKAINSGLGIWVKSEYYNCITSKVYPDKEIVKLSNKCNNLNISSWVLKDESTKFYSFKGIELGAITLHSSNGTDNKTDIFWNSKSNIWNNDRDSLYLFDNKGNIANYNSYGY